LVSGKKQGKFKMNELLGNVYFWTFLAFAVGTLGWFYTQLKDNIKNSAEQSQSIKTLADSVKTQIEAIKSQSDDIKKITEMANRQDKALSEVRKDTEEVKKDIMELDNILKTDIKKFIDTGKEVVAEFRSRMKQIDIAEQEKKEVCAKQEQKLEDYGKNLVTLNQIAQRREVEVKDIRKDLNEMAGMKDMPQQMVRIGNQLEKIFDRVESIVEYNNNQAVAIATLNERVNNIEDKQPRSRTKRNG